MKDEIFYCSDIGQLKQELVDNGYAIIMPKYEEIVIDNGEESIVIIPESITYTHGNTLTPIKYNGVNTLSLVRDNKLNLDKFMSLENLGTYDDLFSQEDKDDEYAEVPVDSTLGKYRHVYPYHIPVTYIDEDGIEQSYMLPKKIGVFA